MKVILLENVQGSGKAGDLIEVSDGYARNFLIPKKLATEATPKNLNLLKQQEDKRKKQKDREISEAKSAQEKLQNLTVKVIAKGGEGGRLFGSVTTKEIVEALQAQEGIKLEKNKLVQDDPIKTCGTYEVKVKLGNEISGVIQVVVTNS